MSMNTLIILEVKFYSAVLCEGVGLGLETKDPRSWSWSRVFFKKVLTTTLGRFQRCDLSTMPVENNADFINSVTLV